MTNDQLAAILAERVMGWKARPDRYIKAGRNWIPKWRFEPLIRLEDAFLLLDKSASTAEGVFTAEVRVGEHLGKATGVPKARTISFAISRALRIGTV